MIKLNAPLENMKERKRNRMSTFIEYIYIYIKNDYILCVYLEPSHCVKQCNVNSGELLKRKEEEKYRHGFPSGRFQEPSQFVGYIAVFAPPLLIQFNFVLFHNGSKMRLDH